MIRPSAADQRARPPAGLTWLRWYWLPAVIAASGAAEWRLPPVGGELEGDVAALKLPGAPALHWKLSLSGETEGGARRADLEVAGEGTRARAAIQFEADGRGIWRLEEAQLDVARWLPVILPLAGPGLPGLAAGGELALRGEGALRGGEILGRARIEWRDGTLRDTAGAWQVEGLSLQAELGRLWPDPAGDNPFVLTFREARAAGLVARDGRIEFTTDFRATARVTQARWLLLGGSVELAPFTLPFDRSRVDAEVRLARIDLAPLAALLPPVLADARGWLSGRVNLSWSAAAGFAAGNGRLQIDPDEPASLRLTMTPGFLSGSVPPRLNFLPSWLGPLARAFSADNPAYQTLRAIERGEMRLEVNTLDVGLQPEGDPGGRTARVLVTARPARNDVVESVRFEINVSGPLADVVRMGLDGRVNVRAR